MKINKSIQKELEQVQSAFERALNATDFYAALAAARVVSDNLESLVRAKFQT